MTPFMRRPAEEIVAPHTDADDLRVAHRMRPDDSGDADAALLGVPFDGGVTAGGGRAGAAAGPAAVRRALARAGSVYHLERDLSLEGLDVVDAGDLEVAEETAETHRRLEAALQALLARGVTPIVIGGGHDLTYASLAALGKAAAIGAINIDAHLDVRPLREARITSGTPFRRALEAGYLDGSRFVVLGPHGNRNARSHVEWLRARGGRILSLTEVRRLGAGAAMATALAWAAGGDGEVFVSLDIDSAAQAYAPGCSAPSPEGFRPEELLAFAFLAGAHAAVAGFDLMELNPRFDLDDRTAALAAAAIVHFLFGLANRKSSSAGG
jgi:formimidoylglutamase